ncbi:MAG: DUF2778 domain-containing protein [Enterobacteriaceae bacterium]|jgi:hypothetical protein|nr:DUF2778 domain-containing protein [Enterobacteriaceae bacterium]
MALQGKFIVNNADFAPLIIYGVGTFLAFSGNGAYRNRGGCTGVPSNGPLPAGKYWVVDRPDGGIWSKSKTKVKDKYNKVFNGAEFTHKEWFALFRDDKSINDKTWVNGVDRGSFRLHPGTISEGCITLPYQSDFQAIRSAFLRTQKIQVPCVKNLMAYGYIEVITHGNTCP